MTTTNHTPQQPAQSGEQDERAALIDSAKDKWKIVDGDCREGGDGLITYHVDAFNEGLELARAASPQTTATQPVQTERALTEVGFIVHDELHGWHFAPTVAWTWLGKGRTLYARAKDSK